MAGWKNISDNLARLHAFWTAHTASAPRPSAEQSGTARALSQFPCRWRSAFAAGERETLGRTRTQRKRVRALPGSPGKTHVAIMGAPHGQATGARTGPTRRRGTVGAHLPRRRSSMDRAARVSMQQAVGARSDGSCGILGRARVVWRVLLSAGQPLVLPSKLPPNQTTGLASGSSIC